jgi:hypothetical protein
MWLTETAWPPIIGCLAAAAVLFALWNTSHRTGYLIGTIVALGLCPVIGVVEKLIVTDAEQVEAAVFDLADAVEKEDAERALAHISNHATAERGLVAAGLGMIEVDGRLRITDLQVEVVSSGSRANSHFRANGTVRERSSHHESHVASRWRLTWQREAGEWKIVTIERLRLIGDQKMDPLERRVD